MGYNHLLRYAQTQNVVIADIFAIPLKRSQLLIEWGHIFWSEGCCRDIATSKKKHLQINVSALLPKLPKLGSNQRPSD